MTDYCKMSEGLEKLSNKKIKRIFLTAASRTANELLYRMGRKKPHYPVPAIPIQVGYQPHGAGLWSQWSYIYVCSDKFLWTCWSSGAIIEERR